MNKITVQELFDVGAHYGHRKRFWMPKMKQYIYTTKNGSHIINLDKTAEMFNDALRYIESIVKKGGKILFVGTKMTASSVIEEESLRCDMPYVNNRWLGGMLTNYSTVKQSIKKLKELEKLRDSGGMSKMIKKEALKSSRKLEKLEYNLAGIKNMKGLPDALFVIDIGHENIAIKEARVLNIPVIGIVDTNNDPDIVDHIIPANDDSIRAIRLYTKIIADAIISSREANKIDNLKIN